MTKKKIITLALAAIVAVTAIAGASLAYFTDTKTAKNVITMGNVKITLDEAQVDDYGKAPEGEAAERTEDGLEYGINAAYPGAVVDKDPTIHNVGKNGAYIRATVTVSDWKKLAAVAYTDLKEVKYTDDAYKAALSLLVGTLGDGWSVVEVKTADDSDAVSFVLKYADVLAADDDTTPIFTKVTVPTAITNETADVLNGIEITAEAMQENSFTTWESAFAAFDGE